MSENQARASGQVTVTVRYVGKDDFHGEFPAATVFQSIKVHAMKYFELDPSAAENYVLQFNSADLSDQGHLGDLGPGPITLTLMLKEEVSKG